MSGLLKSRDERHCIAKQVNTGWPAESRAVVKEERG
jgi:hypothetical protein